MTSLKDYVEPPLTPTSYAPGRTVLLVDKQVRQAGITGPIAAEIVRSTANEVFVKSDLIPGSSERPKQYRISSVYRTDRPTRVLAEDVSFDKRMVSSQR